MRSNTERDECACGAIKSKESRECRSCSYARRTKKGLKHGHNMAVGQTPTYKSWAMMKSRCKHSPYYAHVSYTPAWESFEGFLADMGERPSIDHCLSRIDHDGDYEPGNVEWGLKTDNAREAAERRWE